MKQVQIKNRWGGEVLYTADIPDDTPSGLEMRAALEKATQAGADLAGAYLARAYLAGADLAGAGGFILLTDTDHGFRVIALMRGDEWRIYAGCRDFTIDEARAHWGAADYHLPLSGRKVVACLNWLAMEIANGLTLEGGAR